MNLIELNQASRQLPLGGMAAVLETRLHQAQAEALAIQAKLVAENLQSITLPDTGHWLMEQRPAEVKSELKKFLGTA